MDDFIIPLEDPASTEAVTRRHAQRPWKILVVDDDGEVLNVSRFVLGDLTIHDRGLELIYATSGNEAKALLGLHRDIAVALLDVVMETERAGLDLVRHIRDELAMEECRIILRTGQPGYAPELSVIQEYDINDYRTKSELTHTRLVTSVSAALRSYEQVHALFEHRRGLELIIGASSDLLERPAIAELAEGVITQLAVLLKLQPDGILFTQDGSPFGDERPGIHIVGAAGVNAPYITRLIGDLPNARIVEAIESCYARGSHLFRSDHTVLHLQAPGGNNAAIFLDSARPLAELDRQLLDVFVVNIAACFRNVKLVERLDYLAFHDPLTGLANRQGFLAGLEDGAEATPLAVLLDLRHFTDLNDGLGNEFGDALLGAVARRLSERLPAPCSLGRLGSDLFGVAGPPEAIRPEAVSALFDDPFAIGDFSVPIEVRLGSAEWADGPDGSRRVLRRANIALNAAKRHTRSNHERFVPGMEEEISERVEIIGELRTSFLDGGLEVWYQPQVEIGTGRPVGVEALLRWPKGSGFAHPPSVFIPLAEYSGLIAQIGTWVMDEACREHIALRSRGFQDIRVAVNVSMPQFRDPRFIELVRDRIRKSGIPPEFLELEITESIAMDDPDQVKEKLAFLRDLGVCVAIDDFGTGYSSLGQLQALPIDYLKIDRSFVIGITSERGSDFAGTIVDFCGKLGMRSIAEGVETEEQATELRKLGCDIAQGYLYGRPMRPDTLHSWFAERIGAGSEAIDAGS